MSYRVRTQAFTGPFDLLLTLVNRQKVAIGSISIAEVADQYLAEVDRMGEMDLDVASDFVLVASTLLDIKAASLVPKDKSRRAEDDLDDDLANLPADEARELLVQRLIDYKKFRNVSVALATRMETESLMFACTAGPDPEFLGVMPDFLENVTLRGLSVICADLAARRERFLLDAEHVAPRRPPIALSVAAVDRLTRSRKRLTFTELVDGNDEPAHIVALFLAVLELYKRGSVIVRQDELFGEIDIVRVEGAPAFEYDEAALTSAGEDEY